MGKFQLSPKSVLLRDTERIIQIHERLTKKLAEKRRRQQEKKLKHLANVRSPTQNGNEINISTQIPMQCSSDKPVVDKS